MKIKNISILKSKNIRDFSYMITKDNMRLKDNSFIRSCNLELLSKDEIDKLFTEYNIKTVIDLRYEKEASKSKYYLPPKTKYYNISLLEGRRRGITAEKERKKVAVEKVPNIYTVYKEMIVSKKSISSIKKIFKIMMNDKKSCILFHCTFGKDRTGIISLLLLTMLGFEQKDIIDDYLYTNTVNEKIAKEQYDFYLEKTKDEDFAKQMMEVYLAKEDYLNHIIEYMNKKSGSVLNYIINVIGISEKSIIKFRKKFLIDK